MARLQYPNQPNVFKGSQSELYWRYRDVKHYSKLDGQIFKKNRRFVRCCTSSTSSPSSSDQQAEFSARKLDLQGMYYESLVRANNWQVRRMVETEEEMKKVAKVQAEAFHEPVILFNDMFLEFFQAEVLSGLLYRLRNSASDRYACLVAEPLTDTGNSQKELVGVVDVTVQREESVLQHLPGAEEYLYVSGIAVLNKFRQKVATTLLKACDILAAIWGFEYLVLRAYEDDSGARKLYSSGGYRVVSGDSPWMTTWIGRRRRVLMIKQAGLQQ
ncbi:Peptide alpha-N-acetyltransferase [Olea europaea subsp. europaea]|uniref:Peptide alpha-N-acetyltransferase n=1 Tax=Olea europaea subsp. europaea TaxID=158383 RepID=A0A8S0T302_OLEEU|nr:Peptide alpha-N-acetyltransferase [Olea europaea subsp. europaea]